LQKIAENLGFSWAAENHNCNLIGVSLTKPEEEFLPAFDAGLMARYLFHFRL
jgi:hypothetical protein